MKEYKLKLIKINIYIYLDGLGNILYYRMFEYMYIMYVKGLLMLFYIY